MQIDGHGSPGDAIRLHQTLELAKSEGMAAGIWESFPENRAGPAAARFLEADFYVMEAERGGVAYPELVQAFRSAHPSLPAATVTNFGPFIVKDSNGVTDWGKSRVKAAPFLGAGFHCLAECVLPENPQAQPDAQAYIASELLWSRVQPVIYLNAGFKPADYQNLANYEAHCVWSAEYVL